MQPLDPGPDAPRGALAAPGSEERNFAVLAHLGAFAICLFPLGHILAPLLVWLFKREGSAFIEEHAREALNFQISVTMYGVVATVLTFVLIGFLILPAVVLFDVGFAIGAAMRASRGERQHYPLTVRLIR
jgi:uncharacterized protein